MLCVKWKSEEYTSVVDIYDREGLKELQNEVVKLDPRMEWQKNIYW